MSFEFNVPADAYPPFQPSTSSDIADAAAPLVAYKGWIKFVAIIQIALSILYVFILVVIALRGAGAFGIGVVVAFLPIWLGVLMLQTVAATERAHVRGDAPALKLAMGKVKTYFLIQSIITAAGYLFAIVFTVAAARFVIALQGLHNLPH